MEATQTKLLWAVRDGADSGAWVNFFRVYAPMVRNFAKRLGLADADADDATQEVLLLAQDSLRRGIYDPAKGSFRGWLYGISRKRALATRRARHRPTRAQAVPYDSGVDLLSQVEDKHEQAAQEIWEQEWRYALLDEALRQVQPELGDKVFQAFVLYALQQWPADKVAAELGITTSSVYVYKSRVLDAVRAWTAKFED